MSFETTKEVIEYFGKINKVTVGGQVHPKSSGSPGAYEYSLKMSESPNSGNCEIQISKEMFLSTPERTLQIVVEAEGYNNLVVNLTKVLLGGWQLS